jgi:methyl-accepting chemotaxis protein
LQAAADSTQTLYDTNVTGIAAIGAMADDVSQITITNRDAILVPTPTGTQDTLASLDGLYQSYAQHQAAYTAVGLDSAKQALVADAATALGKAQQTAQQVLNPLALANDYNGWLPGQHHAGEAADGPGDR